MNISGFMKFKIVWAKKSDLDGLFKFYIKIWKEYGRKGLLPKPMVKNEISKLRKKLKSGLGKREILIAKSNSTILGALPITISNKAAKLGHFAVGKQYRKKGIGTALLQRCEKEANKKQCFVIHLLTRKDLEPAYALYKKLGYKREGKISKVLYGADAIIMTKILR